MDDSHGDVVILDTAIHIRNLFVELMSSINQGSHVGIEVIMFGEFDTFIGTSCVELCSGTLGLIQ